MTTVGLFIGSMSKNSINRKLANALVKLAPAGLEFKEISIDLPLYNHDFDNDYPQVGKEFKQAVESSDALLIVTPEYNRGMPGSLKNAIDWGSRPWGQNSFDSKRTAVIGTSPGTIGTAVAQQHVVGMLRFLNAPVMGQPEGYIQFTENLVTDDGEVTNEGTKQFLTDWMAAFAEFVTK